VLRDVDCFIDHRGRGDVALQQLQDADAQHVEIDGRHPLGFPIDRVRADQFVERVKANDHLSNQSLGIRISVRSLGDHFCDVYLSHASAVQDLNGRDAGGAA
jgi:hypothetical protein